MAIFFNFSLTSSHLHPLQVENCDSNSRLVVDEEGKFNGKFRLEKGNLVYQLIKSLLWGIKCVFKHQDLLIFGLQSNKDGIIFTYLKLWVAVARHNFK